MKTTIDLDDDLLIEAKKVAAERRTTLRKLIDQGLRQQIAAQKQPSRRRRIRWVTSPGGLPKGLDVKNRGEMHDWIAREK